MTPQLNLLLGTTCNRGVRCKSGFKHFSCGGKIPVGWFWVAVAISLRHNNNIIYSTYSDCGKRCTLSRRDKYDSAKRTVPHPRTRENTSEFVCGTNVGIHKCQVSSTPYKGSHLLDKSCPCQDMFPCTIAVLGFCVELLANQLPGDSSHRGNLHREKQPCNLLHASKGEIQQFTSIVVLEPSACIYRLMRIQMWMGHVGESILAHIHSYTRQIFTCTFPQSMERAGDTESECNKSLALLLGHIGIRSTKSW